jgi:hypothetical protein
MTKLTTTLILSTLCLTGCYASVTPTDEDPCAGLISVIDTCAGLPVLDQELPSRTYEMYCLEVLPTAQETGCEAEWTAWVNCWTEEMTASCDVGAAYDHCEIELRLNSALNACSSPTGAVRKF